LRQADNDSIARLDVRKQVDHKMKYIFRKEKTCVGDRKCCDLFCVSSSSSSFILLVKIPPTCYHFTQAHATASTEALYTAVRCTWHRNATIKQQHDTTVNSLDQIGTKINCFNRVNVVKSHLTENKRP